MLLYTHAVWGIDLESFGDPYFPSLRDYYKRELNRDLWVLDVTSDIGIPSFVAVSRRTDRQPEDLIKGFFRQRSSTDFKLLGTIFINY